MSYSNGYTPLHAQSLIVDFRALDRIREIDLEDMFVVVECGCTWMKLQEALHARGVRTPYYGPVSGTWATVGGVLSNNSFFMGAETAGDTLLGLHVVLANGEILRTGSDALSGRKPFFRQFGPDITGLFVGDAGAYGFKAVAILRLVPLAGATKFLSFKFPNAKAMLGAQVAVSRLGVACECFGFDPAKNEHFAQQSVGIAEGAGVLRKLVARNGFRRGVKQAVQVAIYGRRFMQHVLYSAHMTIDAIDETSARAAEKAARKVCLRSGGTEIPNTFPAVFRSEPFSDLKGHMVGPNGEVWLSLSGFFAY
jgi:D-lactate dehydrogenase (cytochrome)